MAFHELFLRAARRTSMHAMIHDIDDA